MPCDMRKATLSLVSSPRKTYPAHIVCGIGKRRSRRNPDLPCHAVRMKSFGFVAPQVLAVQTYCPHACPFLSCGRRSRNLRNGVRLADPSYGDSPDAKHDCSGFPPTRVRCVVGFCNVRLYFFISETYWP